MNKPLKTIEQNARIISAMAALVLSSAGTAAFAQATTTLRDPLIPGALYTGPDATPITMPPPPPGQGSYVAAPAGMTGSPGYEPWVTNIPADTINASSYTVTLPVSPSTALAPYAFRQQVGSSIPFPSSTPGSDPGELPKDLAGYQPPAKVIPVPADGSMPADTAPTTKWNGQTSKDYGRNTLSGQYSGLYDFGQKLTQKPDLAKTPQESQDGPRVYTETDQLYGSVAPASTDKLLWRGSRNNRSRYSL